MTRRFSQRKAAKSLWLSFGWLAEVRSAGFGVVQVSVFLFSFSFSFSFLVLTFCYKSQSPGSTYGAPSSESIKLIAESINWAHKATKTVTILLKNMVQPCRRPLTQGWFFWHRKKKERPLAPSFPNWLRSLQRLKIRRELASVLTLVSRYYCSSFWNALNFSIVSAFAAVCDQSRSR